MNIQLTRSSTCGLFMLTLASTLFFISPDVLAEERVIYGEVVKVIPITERRTAQRTNLSCNQPKPSRNSGLGALLGWDLLHECDTSSEDVVTGYQVFYKWDDRTYSRTMTTYPGTTVPLLLTVD